MPIAATRIENVETILVDLPTIRPHQLSMTTMKGQTLMILRIRMSDGIVGVGEGTTIGGLAYGPESPEGMKLAIDTYFAPILLQSDPTRIGRTMGAINKAVQGNNFAKCAVETALIDALGKRSQVTAASGRLARSSRAASSRYMAIFFGCNLTPRRRWSIAR